MPLALELFLEICHGAAAAQCGRIYVLLITITHTHTRISHAAGARACDTQRRTAPSSLPLLGRKATVSLQARTLPFFEGKGGGKPRGDRRVLVLARPVKTHVVLPHGRDVLRLSRQRLRCATIGFVRFHRQRGMALGADNGGV